MLSKALTLDPVPVIDGMMYVPGAEGVRPSDLLDERVKTCSEHKFNFRHTIRLLAQHAPRNGTSCSCGQSPSLEQQEKREVWRTSMRAPFVTYGDHVSPGGRVACSTRYKPAAITTLWAYELDHVVTAYRWLMHNRHKFTKCCSAVIVYQLTESASLPAGLYVYMSLPAHLGCTLKRPLAVVDQFNFSGSHEMTFGSMVPAITLDMFPGRDSFSAVYVIKRTLGLNATEYSNRLFGEAMVLNLIHPCAAANATSCNHYEVAIRTERVFVLDLRWKGFNTKSACVKAVPKIRGLQAVIWSNHLANSQDIECAVLAWLFDMVNELPKEVQLIDNSNHPVGVRYILMDVTKFTGKLPQAPDRENSWFIHVHFSGDVQLALAAIGTLAISTSRMGSPSPAQEAFAYWYMLPMGNFQPTPFSCGLRHNGSPPVIPSHAKKALVDWTRETEAGQCMGLGVQYTFYYHAIERCYKMMISHIVTDPTNLHIFTL